MKDLWRHFKCQQCGKCCHKIGLPYDPISIFKIADTLKLSVKETIETYYGKYTVDGKSWESDDSKRTPCPFLKTENDTSQCGIYIVRPEGCRLYPMETDCGPQGVDCPAWTIAISLLRLEQEEDIGN